MDTSTCSWSGWRSCERPCLPACLLACLPACLPVHLSVSPLRAAAAVAPSSAAATIAPSSVLNVAALEDIFGRFHGQLDTWLQAETGKLERAEARGDTARGELQQSADRVCEVLREQAPRAYAELGPEPAAGDAFNARTLPKLLELLEEDQRALQEATKTIGAFADQKFPKNEELASLKEDDSPLPLLKATLRLLASQAKGSRRGRPEDEEN